MPPFFNARTSTTCIPAVPDRSDSAGSCWGRGGGGDPRVADVTCCLFAQVLAGLHFLHKRCRIIHADVKPENILLYGPDKSLQRLLPDMVDCGQRTDLGLKGPGEHSKVFLTRKGTYLFIARRETERRQVQIP